MENINPKNILSDSNSRSSLKLGIKLLLILIISILLLIPQAIIMDMVNERSSTEGLANLEVNEKWGNGQTLTGPVLFIPGDSAANNLYILPETLDIAGNINSRTLKRGIYDFTVYETALTLAGRFSLPKELKAEQLKSLRTDRAKLLFAISDFKGFSDNPALVLDGQPAEYLRANYILRAMVIPEGDHVIEFRNEAPTMHRLDTITLVCSIVTVLVIAGVLVIYYRKRKKDVENKK